MKFDKLKFVVLLYWRGSALAFPSGEGGTANAVTEEVYRQYVFAKTLVITQLFTAPLPPPFGGTPFIMCDCHRQSFIRWASPLSKGEGFELRDKFQFEIISTEKSPLRMERTFTILLTENAQQEAWRCSLSRYRLFLKSA